MAIHSVGGEIIGNRRDESKYDAILEAAIEVIGEAGFHHAQISRIAKRAGVADGTVYLYFKNKEDILISILRHTIGKIVEQGTAITKERATASGKLRDLINLYFEELGKRQNLAMVTQVHLRQVDANIRRQIGDIMKPFYNLLDDIIESGIVERAFSPNINRRIARRMIFGTMDETVTAWVLSGGKYDLPALGDDVVDVLLHGVVGQRQLELREES